MSESHITTSSFKVITDYGIPRSSALYMLHNIWKVDKDYRDIFQTYYILRWTSAHFRRQLHNGTLTKDGKTYHIIYHKTNPTVIAKTGRDVFISFRDLQPEYEAYPVVLVTVA